MQNVVIPLLVVALFAAQAGPSDRQKVDSNAANRGKLLYTQHCINCHGSTGKGTDNGPDLIRSAVVLRDRLGNAIGPAIAKGPAHQAKLTDVEVVDLSHFLHQRIEAVASNRTARAPLNVLTGNAEAGRTYFNGKGQCATCHSPTGDLAGFATRNRDAVNLQQTFLFPRLARGHQVEVTVTPATGAAVSGALVRIDDFNVTVRDASGNPQTLVRGPNVGVDVRDPLAAHHALLDTITDTEIHNVVAYLATMK